MQRDVAWGEPAPNGSRDHPWQLTEKRVKNETLTAEEVARYEGYMNDPEMRALRQQMEVDLRKADAEHAAAVGRAKDAAAERERAAQLAKRHRDPEHMDATSRCPAVASGKAPVGVDSSAAIGAILQKEKVKEALTQIATPAQLQEVVEGAKPKKPETILGKIADDVTVFHAEHGAAKDRVLPERGTVARAIADAALNRYSGELTMAVGAGSVYHHVVAPVVDTVIGAGVEILKTAVKGAELRDAVMAQAGAHLSGNSVPTETPKQIMERVDHAFKATGEALQTVMNPVVSTVQSSIELATGSKRAGEVLTEPALMALTEGALRLTKPALTVAKTGLKTAVNTVRHLEVTVDSAAFLRHNAGIPFDAVKITTKTPKVEVPTAHAAAAPAATAVAEASVSRAPLSLPYVESGRYVPGKAMMSFELTNPEVLMRGTHNNAAKIPLEVAQKLSGKEFSSFDAFRSEFWKTMADSSYAKEFKPADIARMQKGNAPIVHLDQSLGSRTTYELHHRTPIHDGGPVYDMSNLLIVTPKYHKEILSKQSHYGVK